MRRLVLLLALVAPCTVQAQTLSAIRETRHMTCGVVEGVDDWNGTDVHGDLSRLGTEICRAVSAAALGEGGSVSVTRFPGELEALQALQSGKLELVVGVSPAATTAVHFGVGFGPPVFYDSQRFMVAKSAGQHSVADLRDQMICAMDGKSPERVLRDVMTARAISYGLQPHSEQGEMNAAIGVGRCAGTAMETRLADTRADFPAAAPEFVFLPERIGVAPIVPAYRYGDQAFGLLVDWTVGALIEAEALGITSANVHEAVRDRTDMRAEQLLGHDFAVAQALGLAHEWAAQVISATGNYGEIFERTVGKPYRLERGLNSLWTEGGLMHPPPMQ